MQSLIIGGSTLVDVDNHAGAPAPGEEALEHAGQFAVPERNHRLLCPVGETPVSLESKKKTPHPSSGGMGAHLACWFWRRAAMQRPRVCREVLMLLASFIRSPLLWSLQRSEPARSHRDSLRETR